MNIAEVDSIIEKFGTDYLKPIGFEYRQKNWHYIGDQQWLSLLRTTERAGSEFRFSSFSVAMVHPKIGLPAKINSMKDRRGRYDKYRNYSPISINPDLLDPYIKASDRDSVWLCSEHFNSDREKHKCMKRIYYGGLEYADDSFMYERHNTERCDEEATKAKIQSMIQDVAINSIEWANLLTPLEVARQLTLTTKNVYYENGWLDHYNNGLG